jgi:hypothetical protein
MCFKFLKKTQIQRNFWGPLQIRLFIVFFAFLVSLSSFPPILQAQVPSGSDAEAPVATVQAVQGEIEILRGDGVRRVKGQPGVEVFLGDRVETKAQGTAKIQFVDRSVLSVGKNTTVKITKYLYDAAGKDRSGILQLIMGEIRLKVEPHLNWNPFRPFQYQIQAGSLVAGVRGTDFVVRVFSNGLSEIYCLEGMLALKGKDGVGDVITLNARNFSRIPLGGWPAQPLKYETKKVYEILTEMGEDTTVGFLAQAKPKGPKKQAAPGDVITQGEWAKMLSETLGLTTVNDIGLDESHYVQLLTGGKSRTLEAEGRESQSNYLAKEDSTDASGGSFMEAKSLSGTLRTSTVVPRAGKYPLKVRARGTLLISLGNQTVVMETPPGQEMQWKNLGEFDFQAGENVVNVVVSRGSAIDVFQIDARCANPIQPKGGWNMDDPLKFAEKAETMVKAMEQEGGLPVDGSYTKILRAENVRSVKGDFQRIEAKVTRGQGQADTTTQAIQSNTGTSIVSWTLNLPTEGVYSFAVQAAGNAPFQWNVDGCNIGKNIPEFEDLNALWEEVASRSLPKGEHTLDILVPAGGILEAVRIVKRSSKASDYLALLQSLGFEEGMANETVTASAGQDNLENEFFRNMIEGIGDITDVPAAPEEVADPGVAFLPDEDFPFGSPVSPVIPGLF